MSLTSPNTIYTLNSKKSLMLGQQTVLFLCTEAVCIKLFVHGNQASDSCFSTLLVAIPNWCLGSADICWGSWCMTLKVRINGELSLCVGDYVCSWPSASQSGYEFDVFVGGGLGSLTTCTQNCGSMEDAGRVFNKRLPKVFTETAKVLDYLPQILWALELFYQLPQFQGVRLDFERFVGVLTCKYQLFASF
jgi:hypothetical protein